MNLLDLSCRYESVVGRAAWEEGWEKERLNPLVLESIELDQL